MSSETREGRPDFLREAEGRARRERKSVKAALAADRERLRTLPYPGPDCLDPEEIEQLSGVAARTPVWAEARLGHVEGCEDCATLLLMSEPGAVSLERMIAAVRVRIAEEPAPAAISRVREGRNRREPAWVSQGRGVVDVGDAPAASAPGNSKRPPVLGSNRVGADYGTCPKS